MRESDREKLSGREYSDLIYHAGEVLDILIVGRFDRCITRLLNVASLVRMIAMYVLPGCGHSLVL